MRRITILGALGIVAALVSGCALDAWGSGGGPAEEPTGEERSAFDASLFKFGVWITDDGKGRSGGWQRAAATLNFVDTRESFLGKRWSCLVVVQLPIRLNHVVITPGRAAEMTAVAADAAGSTVMHSQPSWPISVLFCKRFAEKIERIFATAPGGPFGARVTAQ